jgi:hypothetical protein
LRRDGRIRAASPPRQEADELGPEPPGSEAELWREERWGAVVLLAGLADDNVELLDEAARLLGYRRRGQAATPWSDKRLIRTADERADREAARLLLDAATLAEIGA